MLNEPIRGPVTADVRRPVFILGMGRSGTTLLARLLCESTALRIMPEERHFFRQARSHPAMRGNEPNVDAFWRDYVRTVRFLDAGLDADDCYARAAASGAVTLPSLFAGMLAAFAETVGAARVGEKTTDDPHSVDLLRRAFPDARFVLVRRDPRAAIASQLRTPWNDIFVRRADGTPSRRGRIGRIVGYARLWNEFAALRDAKTNEPYLMECRYEALVTDPEGTMRSVRSFIEEPVRVGSGEAASPALAPRIAVPGMNPRWASWRSAHHRRSGFAVDDRSLARWTEELAPAEVAVIEGVCGRSMRRAGYAPRARGASRAAGWAAAEVIARRGLFLHPVRPDDMQICDRRQGGRAS